MSKLLHLPLTKQQTEVLGSFLGIILKNTLLSPELADYRTDTMKEILDTLDYVIHEETDFCDRKDCSYVTNLKRKKEQSN